MEDAKKTNTTNKENAAEAAVAGQWVSTVRFWRDYLTMIGVPDQEELAAS